MHGRKDLEQSVVSVPPTIEVMSLGFFRPTTYTRARYVERIGFSYKLDGGAPDLCTVVAGL